MNVCLEKENFNKNQNELILKCGIDVGSTTVKAVVLDDKNTII